MASNPENYFGGPRHAPKPELGDAQYFGRTQVGSISTPPLTQDAVGGTSYILNDAGRGRSRPFPSGDFGEIETPVGPLEGLGAAQHEILNSSRPSSEPTLGEKLSDADKPNQGVKYRNGQATHYRQTQNGDMQSSPVGSPAQEPWVVRMRRKYSPYPEGE